MPYEKRFDTVLDLQGRPVANAQIRVLEYPGGGDATIYSDRSGVNPVANTLVADEFGFFEYYAADGTYTWEITTNLGTRVINDILHGNAPLDIDGVGFVVTDGDSLFTRDITVQGDGLSILYGDGQSGDTVLSLDDDVAAIEALTGTGFLARTGINTWELTAVDVSPVVIIALQDAASHFNPITTGTDKDVLECFPGIREIKKIWASNGTPGTVQSTIIDVNVNGTSIMTTHKLTIEANEESTDTATNLPALTTTSITHGDRVTVDYDQVGTGVKDVTVYMACIIESDDYP